MFAKPEPRKALVISDAYAVAAALARIGITNDVLHLAGSRGHVDRMYATANDFPGRGEYDAASTALKTICEEGSKLPASWHRGMHLGIPVAFNLDQSIAIAVTSGDEWVAIDGERDPSTRPEKGPNTERAVTKRPKLRLLHPSRDDDGDLGVDLHYLLTQVDDQRVRMELSRSAVFEDGRVTGWHERIILGGIDLRGLPARAVPSEPIAPTEINPTRKSG